jgi:hypothetical protein
MVRVALRAGIPHGSYYLLACADDTDTVGENNASDRCVASVTACSACYLALLTASQSANIAAASGS